MTAITYEMFYACQSLKSIVIPEGVTKIESCAFDNCKNLESVVIPSSVKEIGECAFGLSEKLNAVYYLGSENDWESIYIDDYGKEPLDCAVRYYYSKNEPTTEGNFWYYDENNNIVIW